MRSRPDLARALTPRLNKYIPVTPHPKQAAFLLLSHPEALFGGAAGGGKSVALLMAALQYADLPGYHAVIIRRTYAQLKKAESIMHLSHEWLHGTDARWKEQDKTWYFPSGASLAFGHMDTDGAVHDYQGAAYAFVGFDELTQFSEYTYRYLFSRVRRKQDSPIPLRFRSTSNPGGVGHAFVKERFIVNRTPDRAFIPATIDDNPTLDRAAYVESLSNLDPVTRAQLLRGDWDAQAEGRLKAHWLRYWTRRGTYYAIADKLIEPEKLRDRFLTVDVAASVKTTAKADPDWTVIAAWGTTPCGLLVMLGCDRFRAEIPDLPPRLAAMYDRYRAGKVYIEAGGTQKGVAQLARRHKRERGGQMNIVEYVPVGKGDKLQRAADLFNLAEAGRLWLPGVGEEPNFPREDVVSELVLFTGDPKKDAHDDVLDACAIGAQVHAKRLSRGTVLQAGTVVRSGPLQGTVIGYFHR